MSHIYCNSLVVMISFVVPYIYGSNPPPPSPTIYLSKIKNKNDNSNSRTFYTWMFKLQTRSSSTDQLLENTEKN